MSARPRQNVVKRVVRVTVVAEDGPPTLQHVQERTAAFSAQRLARQVAREIDDGGHAAERRGTAGRLGRLGHHVGLAGPVRRHRNPDVRVRLDASRQHDLALRVDLAAGLGVQRAGLSDRDDPLANDTHVHDLGRVQRNHGSTLDENVQHRLPPSDVFFVSILRLSCGPPAGCFVLHCQVLLYDDNVSPRTRCIPVESTAMELNGGTICSSGRHGHAALGLDSNTIADSASHKVDNSIAVAPIVTDISITTPPGGLRLLQQERNHPGGRQVQQAGDSRRHPHPALATGHTYAK